MLYEATAKLDPHNFPWTGMPDRNPDLPMGLVQSTTATAAVGVWKEVTLATEMSEDGDLAEMDGDAVADAVGSDERGTYLRDPRAIEKCNSVMTPAMIDTAKEQKLPLPVAGVTTRAAWKKYTEMVAQCSTKTPDFDEMADKWNDDVYQNIAEAVKNDTQLPPLYFTDRYRLSAFHMEMQRRHKANNQLAGMREDFITFLKELHKHNDTLTPVCTVRAPTPSAYGGQTAAQLAASAAVVAATPPTTTPAQAGTCASEPQPKRRMQSTCKPCGQPMRSHRRGQCRVRPPVHQTLQPRHPSAAALAPMALLPLPQQPRQFSFPALAPMLLSHLPLHHIPLFQEQPLEQRWSNWHA